MVKKFRNGKVKLEVKRNEYYWNPDGTLSEVFYFDEMELNNLYIVTIEGELFIVDFSTSRVYDFYNGYLIHNPLKYVLDVLAFNKKLYLYPLSKRESKALLKKYYKEQLEEFGWFQPTYFFFIVFYSSSGPYKKEKGKRKKEKEKRKKRKKKT